MSRLSGGGKKEKEKDRVNGERYFQDSRQVLVVLFKRMERGGWGMPSYHNLNVKDAAAQK